MQRQETILFHELKKTWHHLGLSQPGERFQEYHRYHQAQERSTATRLVSLLIGVVIVAIGIVALPGPGPGTLIIALGAAFLAKESLAVARLMDWAEVRLRRVWLWARSAWKRASLPARIGVAVAAAGVVGVAVYLAYAVTLRA
jgi:uncharacterized protein (TIGR02611 family)